MLLLMSVLMGCEEEGEMEVLMLGVPKYDDKPVKVDKHEPVAEPEPAEA